MTAAPVAAPERPSFAAADYGLYAATVLLWGTTWLAVKYQVGTIDPQVSLAWRFLIAAPVMLAVAAATGTRLAFPARSHLRFAALGLLLFSTNFILFYHAAAFLVSGLLAVLFSLAAPINILFAAVLLGEPLRPRVLLGAALGLAGIGLLFGREIADAELGGGAAAALALGLLGTISFCLGNIVSLGNRRAGIPMLSSNAWGLVYGVAINAGVALLAGSPFAIEPTARYVLALLWLAVPGTVAAFWMYLALLARIGPDRAAYTTVLAPVLALVVSTVAEGYEWTAAGSAGLALVLAGNLLVLTRRRAG